MATVHGNGGDVQVGGTSVASITSFSLSMSAETADATAMGDTWRSHKAGHNAWEGTVECFWDPDDASGQEALTIGASVSLELQPEGTGTTGDVHYDGTAIITSIEVGTPMDGMVTRRFSFQGSGTLTTTTDP